VEEAESKLGGDVGMIDWEDGQGQGELVEVMEVREVVNVPEVEGA
jgi:hypothetical protein